MPEQENTALIEKNFHVIEQSKELCKLVVPDAISSRTLEDMDKAISNFKMDVVSPAIDLPELE